MDEQRHVALPKLYGAPAYARPAVSVTPTPRPITPDDLPIAAEMTDEDLSVLAMLPEDGGRVPATPGRPATVVAARAEPLKPRRFSIRAFADRLRRSGP